MELDMRIIQALQMQDSPGRYLLNVRICIKMTKYLDGRYIVSFSIYFNQSIHKKFWNGLSPLNNEWQLSEISIAFNVSSPIKGISEHRGEFPQQHMTNLPNRP